MIHETCYIFATWNMPPDTWARVDYNTALLYTWHIDAWENSGFLIWEDKMADKKPVDKYLAMTGEITLRGRITEIGGVKEKVLAANRAGIKKVLLPAGNERNYVEDIPENIKNTMQFVFVQRIEDVLKEALMEPKAKKAKTKDK